MEFKSFPKIERIGKLVMTITQKIHGSNAQIVVYDKSTNPTKEDFDVKVGSRNRWITPIDDNYGFAAYVEANKDEIISKLGVGTHFGEWAGPGINSGEGLTEKTLVLFEHWKYPKDRPLPPQMKVVPLLYRGKVDFNTIEEVMTDLKTNGSKLVPGFMRPEGIVIEFGGTRYKKVFEAEETQWTKSSGVKNRTAPVTVDLSHLLQPIRLEKLLSRDERYIKEYPKSLGSIVQDYVKDLDEEKQLGTDPDEIRSLKKYLGSQVFLFVKTVINEKLGL